jgi:AraC-like DNA-binding protein
LDDGPDDRGEIVRATVGVVRAAKPRPTRRSEPEHYRLIVQMQGSAVGDASSSVARIGTVVRDVLAVALTNDLANGSANGPANMALPDARRDELLARIHRFIESNLGNPELTPATVAAAHHISLRYLHKLFEAQPYGVAGMIRQRRLEQCRRDLLNPAQAHRPVAAIAARWGFASAAHFSRVFRESCGLPPAEFRRVYSLRAAS